MPKSQPFYRFGDSLWLILVGCEGLACGYRTVVAPSGADISENHQGCGLIVPAFPDVGAPSFFTDGVKGELIGKLFHLNIVTSRIELYAKPWRK